MLFILCVFKLWTLSSVLTGSPQYYEEEEEGGGLTLLLPGVWQL